MSTPNCDAIDGKAASVCEVQPSHTPGLTFADTMELSFTEENNIVVTYTGTRKVTGRLVFCCGGYFLVSAFVCVCVSVHTPLLNVFVYERDVSVVWDHTGSNGANQQRGGARL